jgi:hypothetical protein
MAPEEAGDAYYEGGMFFKPSFGIGEWKALKQRLLIGSVITGKVVHQAPFGVFVDAGLGFLILMHYGSFGPGIRYPDDYPPLHSELSGQILGFHGTGISSHREIVVGPVSPSEVIYQQQLKSPQIL